MKLTHVFKTLLAFVFALVFAAAPALAAFQFSDATRNAALDAIETTIGTAPTLEIRSGAAPANCATADSGTVLVTMTLPSDWMAAASAGSKAKLGTWQDASADATGTAGHFRIKAGATCHIQGSVTATGGGGDIQLQNTSIATGQAVTITSFTISN
ncbi:hypothetical protein QKW60_05530 [Defluviimonas aestuarii]|uniref:hypothetical protein n=1 Tax=Albidovulum aestuarii TaxID=1130726 RepID=UPI00249BFF1C|nr:hypothetical protein [Defluviimonas aestuarii]MDI3335857.1 hypothetical protein [Defluviimonas aestuarii]